MILKIVTLFLLGMMLLGLIGKFRGWLTGRPGLRGPRDQRALRRPGRCRRCGRFLLGRDSCDCGAGPRRKG